MSATAVQFAHALEPITCCNCGVLFAVPDYWHAKRRADHNTFWCPNGHEQHFAGKSEADVLREQLKQTETRLQTAKNEAAWQQSQREQAERSARAQRAIATRIKNRLAKGLCPCCGKHFPEMREHIAERHPNYVPADGAVTV